MHARPTSLTPWLLAALGFIAAVGPVATDMYLASFTAIAEDLNTEPSRVQLTLTAFLLGMGIGQLVLGPLSDRFGRRRVLLVSVSVFAAAGIAMVFSPTIGVLITLRAVQGFSGAGSVVIARAIAADLSTGATAVRALSLIAMVGALGPMIAPPIGGLVSTFADWRGVLATVALISVLMLIVAVLVVPESLPAHHRSTGGAAVFRARIGGLVRDRGVIGFVVAFAFGFATMMSYISASPFVGQTVLGLSPLTYSLGFALSGTAMILANFTNSRLAPRVGPRRMLAVGLGCAITASAMYTVLALTGTLTPPTFIAGAFIASAGAGLTMSNASALALARTGPQTRGAGAALLGATQFFAGGLASPLVGLWGEDTAVPMALIMLTASLLAALGALFGRTVDD